MSTAEENPVPPIPQLEPPIDKSPSAQERFAHVWMRWFDNVRTKINVINALLANFSKLVGTGFPSLNGSTWNLRTMSTGPGVDVTNGDGVAGNPTFTFNADTGEVAHLLGATYKTVQKTIDVMFSPGIITGGEVTELTTTSVRITGGTAIVRIADDNVSELVMFDFASQDFSVPDVQVTHFYALDYNGGSPIIVESSGTENWDRDTEIPLGSSLRGDGILNVTANPYRTGDVITNLIQRLDAIGPVQRDNSIGGLALGETGTRNVTVSAGRLWARVSDFLISSKNSSVNTMSTVFFNGVNLTVTSGITQWDNLNFNNLGTGLLQVMGNNKYANLWFFMSFDGEHYGFAYGTNEYNTLGDAANEGVPSYLTQNFFNQFVLLGRFIFQKSAATADIIESAFVTPFTTSAINTHNNLGGLQVSVGAPADEYYHTSLAENTAITAAVGAGGGFVTIAGSQTVTGSKTLTGMTRLQNGSTSGGLIIGADVAASTVTNAVRKLARMTMPTYLSDTVAPMFVFGGDADVANRLVRIGGWGGATGMTAALGVRFGCGSVLDEIGGVDRWEVTATRFAPLANITYDIGTSGQRVLTVFTQNINQSGARFESGVVTPAQLTANTDNWVVAGLSTTSIIRASTDASRNLTGISSPTANQMLLLVNVGAQDLVLVHDATSTAANRFFCPGNVNFTLNAGDSVRLWYDSTSSRWRVLGV